MSTETTTAIERAQEAYDARTRHFDLRAYPGLVTEGIRDALDAALDVEEMARAIHADDQGPDVWDIEGEKFKEMYRENARAIRAALLGGAS